MQFSKPLLLAVVVSGFLSLYKAAFVAREMGTTAAAWDLGFTTLIAVLSTGGSLLLYDKIFGPLKDSLTGSLNKLGMEYELERAAARSVRSGKGVGVVFLDVDNFKEINSKVGHLDANKILCATALKIREMVRGSDSVARFGGDEFVVILEGISDSAGLATACEKIHESVPVQVSMGAYLWRPPTVNQQEALKRANYSLRLAKRAGKNHVEIFD